MDPNDEKTVFDPRGPITDGLGTDEPSIVEEWDKDEKYYFTAGDCVVKVESTLFKVHRFILSRDSSAFQHMFSVSDQGFGTEGPTESEDDQHPMVLYGETADNFRLLLSILYALPAEIAQFSTSDADIPTLLTIAEMTNKYSFISTSKWAIDTLYALFKDGIVTNQWHPTLCRSSLFKRIIEVSVLCGHQGLCDFAINNWVERILNRTANPLIAMPVADKYDLAQLQGVSYYVALLESGPNFELNVAEFECMESGDSSHLPPQPPFALPAKQKARLLSGFFSLVNLWETLRINPPTFERPDGCTYHAHGCLGTWQHTWRTFARSEVVSKLRPADVIARLKAMQDVLAADGDIAFALTPVCRRAAMGSLKELIRKVQDDLAVYFVDLTEPVMTGVIEDGSEGSGALVVGSE
ncbi:hypothetical protein BDY19DRAFT_892468 [Irpex rosettiformis]|uniref:Uncharacterized protein n=1 Tax=Irpex rosettiformis TaxID=378272 RepID=A0ACB8U0D0_9APHY|nr:hypothetical protein BDY19DRAFT_892468 [Irpex rosettiformis]